MKSKIGKYISWIFLFVILAASIILGVQNGVIDQLGIFPHPKSESPKDQAGVIQPETQTIDTSKPYGGLPISSMNKDISYGYQTTYKEKGVPISVSFQYKVKSSQISRNRDEDVEINFHEGDEEKHLDSQGDFRDSYYYLKVNVVIKNTGTIAGNEVADEIDTSSKTVYMLGDKGEEKKFSCRRAKSLGKELTTRGETLQLNPGEEAEVILYYVIADEYKDKELFFKFLDNRSNKNYPLDDPYIKLEMENN